MRCEYYLATLRHAPYGYVAEFADLPVSSFGETPCDAENNAIFELNAYADRVQRSGAKLPASSAPTPSDPDRVASEPDAYILVPLTFCAEHWAEDNVRRPGAARLGPGFELNSSSESAKVLL